MGISQRKTTKFEASPSTSARGEVGNTGSGTSSKTRSFDKVDPSLIGKYKDEVLSTEYLAKTGPLPWNYAHIPPLTFWEWFFSPFILFATVFIKAPLVLGAIAWIYIFANLIGFNATSENKLKGWHRHFFYQVQRPAWLALMAVFNWFNIQVRGEYDRYGAPIIVSNHVSWVDPAVLWVCLDGPTYVVRAATKKFPVMGRCTNILGCLYMSRTASEGNEEVKKQIKSYTKTFPATSPLVMFVEGTTTNGKCLLEFKDGAFEPGVPVQPVVMRHGDGHFVNMEQGHWTWITFTLLATIARHKITVDILPVYHPSAEEKANPSLYANNVRKVMAAHMNVPMIDGLAVRERYLWFDHFYYRSTSKEQYRAQRQELRRSRNGGQPVTLTYPDGTVEALED